MCGIFGIVLKKNNKFIDNYGSMIKDLFLLSESRGKEAAGFAARESNKIVIYKTPFSASKLVKSNVFVDYFKNYKNTITNSLVTLGHSRLVTNGYEHFNKNNQPVVKNGICVIHNGIIVNQAEIWKSLNNEERISDLDTEIIPTLISKKLKEGCNIQEVITYLYNIIYGMSSIALLFDHIDNLLLATNNGSIYYASNKNEDAFIFASEEIIIKNLIKKNNFDETFDVNNITNLYPNSSLLINLKNLDSELIAFNKNSGNLTNIELLHKKLIYEEIIGDYPKKELYINTSFEYGDKEVSQKYINEYNRSKERISELKRCKKCILPETFPNIRFDDKGVCNNCNDYSPINYYGKDKLVKLVSKYIRTDRKHDCLLAFSGGRDSSYMLHFVKKELGMNPIAYSYDWGMITDLARRNQARLCGKLGVEHIYISADIRKKRSFINKNVAAWLINPNLGTVPLFMAGDKQYFYHAYKLKKNYSLDLLFMGENHLEKTGFKTAFSGAKQTKKGTMAYNIDTINKARMTAFYLKEYIKNPTYLNSSLIDTFTAYLSYYIYPHNYLNFYDFVKWDETLITNTLLNEYAWEIDPGTNTTWRIGDGTAAFYNYIYFMVAGFTENDTFRSNQIREGVLGRDEALEFSEIENKPRWESLKWYCETVNIDFDYAIEIINKIPKLYA